MGNLYSAELSYSSITSASYLQFIVPAGVVIKVHEIAISQGDLVGDTSEELSNLAIYSGFTTLGAASTAVDMVPHLPGSPASSLTAQKSGGAPSGGSGYIIWNHGWNNRFPYLVAFPEALRLTFVPGQFFYMYGQTPAATDVVVNITLEEFS